MCAAIPALMILLAGVQTAAPAGSLAFTAPEAWKPRPAASSMRVAEFVVPRAEGDTEDGEAIIYYFGARGGGGVEANIDRWIGQMKQPDGSPSKDKAVRDEQTVNDLKVATVDVAGTYVAEMSPGSTEHYNKPGYRLRAAVVETPRGAYYVKITGPAKTMAAAEADFKKLVGSLRFAQ
jgi:hypothetical protein